MAYNKRDGYYRMAKREGYRSRSTYKLKQIDLKFRIMSPGRLVVDLGAAPGGWSQVAVERVGPGFVIAADLKGIEPIEGVRFVPMNVFDRSFADKVMELGGPAHVILSDMAPDITGQYSMDHARSVHLAERVLELAERILLPGGKTIVKVFQGDLFPDVLAAYKAAFRKVKCHSPEASRKSSSEIYIIGISYRGPSARADAPPPGAGPDGGPE